LVEHDGEARKHRCFLPYYAAFRKAAARDACALGLQERHGTPQHRIGPRGLRSSEARPDRPAAVEVVVTIVDVYFDVALAVGRAIDVTPPFCSIVCPIEPTVAVAFVRTLELVLAIGDVRHPR